MQVESNAASNNTTFLDDNGDQWSIRVDVNTLKRVQDLTGVNLAEVVEEGSNLIERLDKDPVLLVGVVWAVLKPQCELRDITPEEFGSRIIGDTLQEASEAFLYALIRFFPKARRGPLLIILDESLKTQQRMNALLDGPRFKSVVEKQAKEYEQHLIDMLEKYSENGSSSTPQS